MHVTAVEIAPIGWGVRMDGESLLAMRNFGSLELGYNEEYFRRALTPTGWSVSKHGSLDMG